MLIDNQYNTYYETAENFSKEYRLQYSYYLMTIEELSEVLQDFSPEDIALVQEEFQQWLDQDVLTTIHPIHHYAMDMIQSDDEERQYWWRKLRDQVDCYRAEIHQLISETGSFPTYHQAEQAILWKTLQ